MEYLRLLVENKEWKKAIEVASDLHKSGENSEEYWMMRAQIYLALDNMTAVRTCVQAGLLMNNKSKELYKLLADSLVDTNPKQAHLIYQYLESGSMGIEIIKYHRHEAASSLAQKMNEVDKSKDILLLGDDVKLVDNSELLLHMSLYERDDIAAASPMLNWTDTDMPVQCAQSSWEKFYHMVEKEVIYDENAYEYRTWIGCGTVMLKHSIWDCVVVDANCDSVDYLLGDIQIQLLKHHWKLVLCHNCFAYSEEDYRKSFSEAEEEIIKKKYGHSWSYYINPRIDLIEEIRQNQFDEFTVLEVGCGAGSTLLNIKYQYPNAKLEGIELMKEVAELSSNMVHIVATDVEQYDFPYALESIDYVIFGDVLEHLRDPERLILRLKPYLSRNGKIISSIPNLMNRYVIAKILQGDFTYTSSGLLDQTHIHFFTYKEILKMFCNNGYEIVSISGTDAHGYLSPEEEEMMNQVLAIPGVADEQYFKVYQFMVVAQNVSVEHV